MHSFYQRFISFLFKKSSFTAGLLLASLVLWFCSAPSLDPKTGFVNRSSADLGVFMANNPLIPIGTPLTIPPWVMEQYISQGQEALYGDPLNFLILNYGVPAPVADNKQKDTYYVPLTRYKAKSDYDDYDHYERRRSRRTRRSNSRGSTTGTSQKTDNSQTVMVDVNKITIAKPKKEASGAQPTPAVETQGAGGAQPKSTVETQKASGAQPTPAVKPTTEPKGASGAQPKSTVEPSKPESQKAGKAKLKPTVKPTTEPKVANEARPKNSAEKTVNPPTGRGAVSTSRAGSASEAGAVSEAGSARGGQSASSPPPSSPPIESEPKGSIDPSAKSSPSEEATSATTSSQQEGQRTQQVTGPQIRDLEIVPQGQTDNQPASPQRPQPSLDRLPPASEPKTESTSQAEPAPQTEKPAQTRAIVFETTEEIDPSQAPPVPEKTPPVNLSQPSTAHQATCDQAEVQTEASAPCVDCTENNIGQSTKEITDFLNIVNSKTQTFARNKNFPAVIRGLCKKCEGMDVGDFFSYMEERAGQSDVPKEVLFAIMMQESNGNCVITGDNDGSYGLFQLNTKNSTKLRACKQGELKDKSPSQMKKACTGGQYRGTKKYNSVKHAHKDKDDNLIPARPPFSKRPNIGDMVCLENPYCNFEEALHLLKVEKWDIGNKQSDGKTYPPHPPKGKKSWVDLNVDERNQWRNAIIAYNGNFYHNKAKRAMRKALNIGDEAKLDNWELKRMFFIKHYLYRKSRSKGVMGLIDNLAYVESMTGRESKGLAGSSICQWARFRKDNPAPSCS